MPTLGDNIINRIYPIINMDTSNYKIILRQQFHAQLRVKVHFPPNATNIQIVFSSTLLHPISARSQHNKYVRLGLHGTNNQYHKNLKYKWKAPRVTQMNNDHLHSTFSLTAFLFWFRLFFLRLDTIKYPTWDITHSAHIRSKWKSPAASSSIRSRI